MDYETMLFKVRFDCERIPKFMRRWATKRFMELRSKACDVFNEHISEVNEEWNRTGKKASFGPHIEDINPEYGLFVFDRIQPKLDYYVNRKSGPIGIFVGKDVDLYGTVKWIKGSKITLWILPVTQ